MTPQSKAVLPNTVGVASGDQFRVLDRLAGAYLASTTFGLSPIAGALAFTDWASHLAHSPGKKYELLIKAEQKATRLAKHAFHSAIDPNAPGCIQAMAGDYRFKNEAWQQWPYRFWSQAFLLNQQWWHNATHNVPGVSRHHEDVVSFAARQWLDIGSPANWPLANPEIIQRTLETAGQNFAQGATNWLQDWNRLVTGQRPVGSEKFIVGKTVATAPGKVVFQNHLIELIQYEPTTANVFAQPVLIVPAWIMKYYILDLSPDNSLVRFLVARGHTVFCISWRNVTAADRDISFEDYRKMGVMAAIDVVNAIMPGRKIHAAGYCLGGTLLATAAAAMAQSDHQFALDDIFASITLFAAQTDFTEPGELQLFIDESQVDYLEDMMWEHGTLDAAQMASAFQMLRSNDLVWSRIVREYMMGERAPMNDLMAWNADPTRLPYKMQSDYLRRFFLNNDLASGRYMVDGKSIALKNIHIPMFVVGTERDHIAPWKSVYKIHYLTETDVTFILTSGGHNAGIVSEPGHAGRHFHIMEQKAGDRYLDPNEWTLQAPVQQGSWWINWHDWLCRLSSEDRVVPPHMGTNDTLKNELTDAPGSYVLQC
eukprot:gene15184-15327_t